MFNSFREIANSLQVESSLQERLQNAFFKYEKSRPDFAELISNCEKHISIYKKMRKL